MLTGFMIGLIMSLGILLGGRYAIGRWPNLREVCFLVLVAILGNMFSWLLIDYFLFW